MSNNSQPVSVDLCLFMSDLLFFNYHNTSVGIVGIPTEVNLKKKITTAQTEEMQRIWYTNEAWW